MYIGIGGEKYLQTQAPTTYRLKSKQITVSTHKYPLKNVRSTRKYPNFDKKCRFNAYVSHLYIIVSSEVLYTHTLLKHRAGLYIGLGSEKYLDTGRHNL